MYRLIRFLAVIALALSPVWGVQTVDAMHSAYPVWPSFLSTGCNGIQGPGGSTTIACGQGAFLLSQVNSGYECTTVYISVTQYQSGPFTVVGTANSGSLTNTVSIDDTGDYYMQFQGYLTNNLVSVQISAPGSGAMTIGTIGTGPCPVPPTSTPVPATNTPNPSDTATPVPDTATAGPSHTPTVIPTFTPLPRGHSTFTVTRTATPGPSTATPSATGTPGIGEVDCGQTSFPLLNCNNAGNTFTGTIGNHWYGQPHCFNGFQSFGNTDPPFDDNALYVYTDYASGYIQAVCRQDVVAGDTGTIYIQGSWLALHGIISITANGVNYDESTNGSGVLEFGSVTAGTTVTLSVYAQNNDGYDDEYNITNSWISGSSDSPTPGPPLTLTSTPTLPPLTATAAAKATLTALTADYTATPIPIPGAMSTPIATSTECLGGCAVAALTAIPGLSTRVVVDTSPFSELTHLSLARNSCKAFGYVQIPMPVIHGTPVLGSTTPLSITWTLPVTHDWDNTNPYSNTAIQPCAMNEIPTFVWDLTYWFSVFAIFTVWIMWLLGFVGRFSGDENING